VEEGVPGRLRGEDGEEAMIPLCLFFPDGQISPSEPRYLWAKTGRALSVQVNRWTGAVTVTWIDEPGAAGEVSDGENSGSGDAGDAGDVPAGGRP